MRQEASSKPLKEFMNRNLRLTMQLRQQLKKPLGILVRGTPADTMLFLSKFLEEKQIKVLLCVGDYCSRNAIESGLTPNVIIVDNRTMRKEADSWPIQGLAEFHLNNPAGVISKDAWRILEEAISLNRQAVVYVEGEEDLLTLPVIALAPMSTAVTYGQPMEGLVIVEVTCQIRDRALAFLRKMNGGET